MSAPARVGGSSSRGRSNESRRKKAAAAARAAAPKEDDAPPARTGEGRPRTAAAQRAYARRAQREGRGGETTRKKVARPRQRVERGTASRASFVVLVMGLLVGGVIMTLWLSTQAIADSYRLDQAKKAATELAEQVALLQREVAVLDSAPELAEKAKALGMVPGGDPARLVVQPDGTVVVVGDPKPVGTAPAPVPSADQVPPPVAPDQAPPDQPADQQPAPQEGAG